jgi:hypothetical protein
MDKQSKNIIDLSDFEEMHHLSRFNPEEYNLLRQQAIDDCISNSVHQLELQQLQFRIDGMLRKNKNPITRCNLLFDMISESSEELIECVHSCKSTEKRPLIYLVKNNGS